MTNAQIVPLAPKPEHALILTCVECNAALASSVRRFPPTDHLGAAICYPYCAAISVVDGGRARTLKTRDWVGIVLEPMGFDLLELRVATAKALGLA